jgi:N-acetylneuraminic acid mutarotase
MRKYRALGLFLALCVLVTVVMPSSVAMSGALPDADGDGVPDASDNCATIANPSQANADSNVTLLPGAVSDDATWPASDAFGDACDSDDDNDGLVDATETSGPPCPGATAPTSSTLRDSDGDRRLDGAECALGSDPADVSSVPASIIPPDVDADGLPDPLDPADADVDADDDGVRDGIEFRFYGSDVQAQNRDGDRCHDGREVAGVDGNDTVNSTDLARIATVFGSYTAPVPAGQEHRVAYDMDKNGTINAADLGLAAAQFGNCVTQGEWLSRAPLPAGPRQETAVVALDGEVYLIGGFNAGAAIVATVEAYDPGANTWRAIAPLPVAMHHANAAAVDGQIYVTGFLTGGGFTANGAVYAYDPGTDAWTPKTSMPSGTQRGASGVAVVGTKIYVAGGYRAGAAVADFSAYDTATDTWETLPAVPSPRDHLVAGAIDGVVYVAGGRNGTIAGHIPDLDAYDPIAATWSPRPPMPTSRGGAAAAVIGGRLYVFGGEGSGSGTGVFNQSQAYTAASGHWHTGLRVMDTPRHGTGAAEVAGVIYVPGGATVQAFGAVATNESFTPPP